MIPILLVLSYLAAWIWAAYLNAIATAQERYLSDMEETRVYILFIGGPVGIIWEILLVIARRRHR